MKVYVIVSDWETEWAASTDIEVFDTYEKAVNYFNELIEYEKDSSNSWAGDAFDENGNLLRDEYELNCNDPYTDGKEHELWWYIRAQNKWPFYTKLELRILEVK